MNKNIISLILFLGLINFYAGMSSMSFNVEQQCGSDQERMEFYDNMVQLSTGEIILKDELKEILLLLINIKEDFAVFCEFVYFCRNSELYTLSDYLLEILKSKKLIEQNGSLNDITRLIVNASVEGEAIKMKIINPVKGSYVSVKKLIEMFTFSENLILPEGDVSNPFFNDDICYADI